MMTMSGECLRRRALAGALLGCLFLACVTLYSRFNDFPYFYHGDEIGKVEQVLDMDHKLNFNHPLLLLKASRAILDWTHPPADPQSVVEAGRTASAVLAALAVVFLALTGYLCRGLAGLGFVALTTGLCPSLLLYAHYMKEDAALMLGVSMTLCAGVWLTRVSGRHLQWVAWVALGGACGVAASGKYVGIATAGLLGMVAILVPATGWRSHAARLAVACVAMTAVVLIVNHDAFESWRLLKLNRIAAGSLKTAFDHGMEGHSEITMRQPNTFVFSVLAREITPVAWIGMCLFPLAFARRVPGFRQAAGLISASFFLWILVLSFNTIPFHRYILPCVVQGYLIAGLGFAAALAHVRTRALAIAAGAVFVLAVLSSQVPPCVSFTRQFADDSRQRIRDWLVSRIPPGAAIAAECYVNLEKPGDLKRFPGDASLMLTNRYHLLPAFFIGDLGTLDQLRARGVQYVITTGLASERFHYPQVIPIKGTSDVLARRRRIHHELAEMAVLLHRERAEYPTFAFTNPDISVYWIPPMRVCPGTPHRPTPP